jgi:hypothetical protein
LCILPRRICETTIREANLADIHQTILRFGDQQHSALHQALGSQWWNSISTLQRSRGWMIVQE